MITIFILVGWIHGSQSDVVLNIEFTSLESCEKVKSLYVEYNQIDLSKPKADRWHYESWAECVKK